MRTKNTEQHCYLQNNRQLRLAFQRFSSGKLVLEETVESCRATVELCTRKSEEHVLSLEIDFRFSESIKVLLFWLVLRNTVLFAVLL
jgi:hypothetical protein